MSRSLSDAARALGRKGGLAGRGASQRRAPEHYTQMQARARAARRRGKDYVIEDPDGGWAIVRWDPGWQTHRRDGIRYRSRYYALRAMKANHEAED